MNQGLDHLMEAAGDAVFRLDMAGRILHASQRAARLLGQEQKLQGSALTALAAEIDQPALRNAIADAAGAGAEPVLVQARLKSAEKDIWFELRLSRCGSAPGAEELLAVGRDMSAQHDTEERLRHLATHDALTELPNRLLLSDRIRMVIAHARRSGQGFSVATVGLDGFKKVNDGLGHPVGDAVLRMAAGRRSRDRGRR